MTAESPIVAFLKARWAEEEADLTRRMNSALVDGYIRHNGDRMLRDIEAKRWIVATYAELDAHPNRLTYAFAQQQWVALRAVMAALALPFSDHEDYAAAVGTVTT